MSKKPHTLSDGTTLSVKATRTLIGTRLTEVPSRKRPAGSLLWDDGRMYLLTRNGGMVKISHPDYAYADAKHAVEVALAFFIDSAEASIKHAAEEGISVEECY